MNDLTTHYGKAISVYSGTGTLTLPGGETVPANFETGQLADGTVLLLCDLKPSDWRSLLKFMFLPALEAPKFVGTTDNNLPVTAERLTMTNYLGKTDSVNTVQGTGECYFAFHVGKLEVGESKPDAPVCTARFGIVNFCFKVTESSSGESTDVLRLALPGRGGMEELAIEPVAQAKGLMAAVETLNAIDVTCEAVGPLQQPGGLESLTLTVDAVCFLLSVARGRKFNGSTSTNSTPAAGGSSGRIGPGLLDGIAPSR